MGGKKVKKIKKPCYKINGLELGTKSELVDYLKTHELLQHCTEEKLGGGPGEGRLIWARNQGSVFWPALIAYLEDKPGGNNDKDEELETENLAPTEYRGVIFLETCFRYTLLEWKNIILLNEESFEEQHNLITQLNRHVIRKSWSVDKSYKEAVLLMKDFISIKTENRQAHAYGLSSQRKKERLGDKPVKPKKSASPADSTANNGSDVVKPRTSDYYGLRQLMNDGGPSPAASVKSGESNGKNSLSSASETQSDISRKAKQRPKTGGPPMKEYVEKRFLGTDKMFKFLPATSTSKCATCFEDIEAGELATCHDYPYHKYCLLSHTVKMKDGTIQKAKKCKCCMDQACFICKEKMSEDEKMPTKCSKCELRFHRSCLLAWPQAIVQGSTGPITCPAHFCHTCVGEHYVLRKSRNFRVFAGARYRCLMCPSTYHKLTCIPAGCGENISARDFIICPKHNLSELKVNQRRFGCLTCGKNVKTTNARRVECSLCLQVFHPECVGYSNDHTDGGVTVQAFGAGYKCSSCFWGLFPLYGQVIWFQQHNNPFWPARIMYPRESVGRYEFVQNRLAGQYSIKYFGRLQSFYDHASRTFPLSLATVKLFTNVNVYKELNHQIKSAYDEAGFFSLLVDDHRDKLLPPPEPFYKKIDKNIYRYSIGTNKKGSQDEDAQLECYCADTETGDVCCTSNSGCHNRDTAVECNDNNCKGGPKCQNRMFSQKKKDTENTEQFLTVGKGWAVKAILDFKEGDFIVEYCGEIISNAEMQYRANRKTEEDPLYILEIDKHTFIDAEFCGNVSRLINHSCEPNCRIEKYTSSDGKPVVGVFAHQDIKKGEELTFDYAYGNKSSAPFRCHCGAPSCRGFIGKEASPSTPEVELDVISAELEKYDKECSKCQFGGHVLCCDFEDCYKVYHKSCAGLAREPDEWFCPDHNVKPKAGKKRKSSNVRQHPALAKKKLSFTGKRKNDGKRGTPAAKKRKLSLPKKKEIKTVTTSISTDDSTITSTTPIALLPPKPNAEVETASNKDSGTAENTPSETSSEPSTRVSFELQPSTGKSEQIDEAKPSMTEGSLPSRRERLPARRRLSKIVPKDDNKNNLGVVTEWLKKSEGTAPFDEKPKMNLTRSTRFSTENASKKCIGI